MSARGRLLAVGAVALIVGVLGLVLVRYLPSTTKDGKKKSAKIPPSSSTKVSEKANRRVASIKDTELPKKSGRAFSDSYELEQELDAASFPNDGVESSIKLAVDKSTGEHVVVKIVSKGNISKDDIEYLAVECKLVAALDHPYIIRVLETFDEPEADYIIFEHLNGVELFDRVATKGRYSEAEAKVLFTRLLEALAYMHSMGVVHRNLKPEDIILCEEDDDTVAKIAEFGFAKRILDLTDDEPPCGTPGYVAPEILRGDLYGSEVDIWSLGVVCFIVLSGYPPFDFAADSLYDDIKAGDFEFEEDAWGSVSSDAIDFINRMLTVDQKERWTAEQLLKHPWLLMLADEAASAAAVVDADADGGSGSN